MITENFVRDEDWADSDPQISCCEERAVLVLSVFDGTFFFLLLLSLFNEHRLTIIFFLIKTMASESPSVTTTVALGANLWARIPFSPRPAPWEGKGKRREKKQKKICHDKVMLEL